MNNQYTSIIVVIAAIAFILYRQIRPRKLSTWSLAGIPLILLYFIFKSSFALTQIKIIEIIISSVVSTILGLLACRQLHVYAGPSGKAMAKGSWTYFLWWLAAFIFKSVLSILFKETSLKNTSQLEILIPVFLLIATRNAYIY